MNVKLMMMTMNTFRVSDGSEIQSQGIIIVRISLTATQNVELNSNKKFIGADDLIGAMNVYGISR